jgi:hypothetical protein
MNSLAGEAFARLAETLTEALPLADTPSGDPQLDAQFKQHVAAVDALLSAWVKTDHQQVCDRCQHTIENTRRCRRPQRFAEKPCPGEVAADTLRAALNNQTPNPEEVTP